MLWKQPVEFLYFLSLQPLVLTEQVHMYCVTYMIKHALWACANCSHLCLSTHTSLGARKPYSDEHTIRSFENIFNSDVPPLGSTINSLVFLLSYWVHTCCTTPHTAYSLTKSDLTGLHWLSIYLALTNPASEFQERPTSLPSVLFLSQDSNRVYWRQPCLSALFNCK